MNIWSWNKIYSNACWLDHAAWNIMKTSAASEQEIVFLDLILDIFGVARQK